MKKVMNLFMTVIVCIFLSSCFSHTYTVGKGPQSGVSVSKKNHYLVYGLVKLSNADPTKMAREAKDYEVKTVHTFVDGLVGILTFGIYNPTTSVVTK